eukprot:1530452-Pyramimonas_sp.AAC.1
MRGRHGVGRGMGRGRIAGGSRAGLAWPGRRRQRRGREYHDRARGEKVRMQVLPNWTSLDVGRRS